MKLAKASDEEIQEFYNLLSEIEQLQKEEKSYYLEDIDFSEFEILGPIWKECENEKEFWKAVSYAVVGHHFQRILFNLTTLMENCADPNSSTFDFHPDIKRGLELINSQSKIL